MSQGVKYYEIKYSETFISMMIILSLFYCYIFADVVDLEKRAVEKWHKGNLYVYVPIYIYWHLL